MGQLGFSFVGAAFLLGLFVPNLLWTRAKPVGYDPSGENRVLLVLERAGQVLTTASALLFADTNLRGWSAWSWWMVAAVVLMAAYEACWVRYFLSGRTVRDFYRAAVGVPVPLATLAVAAFVLLGVYSRLPVLVGSALVLGVGHVGIHLQHLRSLSSR